VELSAGDVPPLAEQMLGAGLEAARQLGRLTGEMHLALASVPDDPAFAPEPFTALYQRSLYQSLRSQIRQAFVLLRRRLDGLPEDVRAAARALERREDGLVQRARAVYERRITAQCTRGHGDFNLREVLYDGRDFTVIDFEGQPARPLIDRRRKYSPVRDVAVMVRSFQYVARYAWGGEAVRREDRAALEPWVRFWHVWMAAAFLRSYRETAAAGAFLPTDPAELEVLLDFYLMKRAVNELRAEVARRPERAAIPVQGLLSVLETADAAR